jgi:catechol 2,3-dioxygenase-like lactoylglutathione lyase family enzyme
MELQSAKVTASVPVNDLGKAKEFYEGKLGLTGGGEEPDGGVTYACAQGSEIHIYPSPGNGGKSGGTLAFWELEDVEGTVDELTSNGVEFEQYDMEQIKTNEKGIAQFGRDVVAWFKDPDGNILALGSPPTRA